VLAVLDWMASYGYNNVHIVGRGWGSLPALFAAVLDKRIKRVTLKNAPISFTEWATTRYMQWPLSSCLPYALKTLDLPDCYSELRTKGLRIVQPWNAGMRRLSRMQARKAFA